MGFSLNTIKKWVDETVDFATDPQVIATAALAYATGGLTFSTTAGIGFSTSAAFSSAVSITALSGVSRALASESDDGFGRGIDDLGRQGTQFQFRSPVATREIVYGKVRKSGVIVNIETTDNTNVVGSGTSRLHIAVAFSGAPIKRYTKLFLNDVVIKENFVALANSSADSGTTPDYSSNVSIYARVGDTSPEENVKYSQTSGFMPSWSTSGHDLNGIAHIYLRMDYSASLFPEGLPKISAEIEGKPVQDPRAVDPLEYTYSNNPALCIRDYLLDKEFGLGIEKSEIDEDSFITAANVCDEDPDGGGSETTRYELNGLIDTSKTPKSILQDMLTSCAGTLVYTNGKFRLLVGDYRTPTETIDEDDLRGSMSVSTKNSMREQFNTVKAIYFDDTINQVKDIPVQTSLPYVAVDNANEKSIDLSLPFTNSEEKAVRLATLSLYRMRQEMVVTMPCKMTCFDLDVGDVVQVNNSRLGFTNKTFEVISWTFNPDPSDLGVDIALREIEENVFAETPEEPRAVVRIVNGSLDTRIGNELDSNEYFGSTEWAADSVKELIIEKGVFLAGQEGTSVYALVVSSGMGGSLIIRNKGEIYGSRGGSGGGLGGTTSSPNGQDGSDGGHAIFIESNTGKDILVINDGIIGGGGGGGGGGGLGGSVIVGATTYYGGLGGGFGDNYGQGTTFTGVLVDAGDLDAGSAPSYTNPPTIVPGNGGDSGAGGDLGQPGEDGQDGEVATGSYVIVAPGTGGSGGAAGAAVFGDSNCNLTVNNRGTMYGNIA